MKPTIEFYSLFQYLYDYFNQHLFNEELPQCMIIITRKNRTFGYYAPKRWENQLNTATDELAINPLFFSKYPLIELLQTIVHEMCHGWQNHYGKSSRKGYHNKEWGNKMESIGLMPSNTGFVGGKKTGQQMMDYPIPDGLFLKVCCNLVRNDRFKNMWFDITKDNMEINKPHDLPSNSSLYKECENEILYLYSIFTAKGVYIEEEEYEGELEASFENSISPLSSTRINKNKTKYVCDCGNNVWGKTELSLFCKVCKSDYIELQ